MPTSEGPLRLEVIVDYFLTPPAGFKKLDVVSSTSETPYVYIDVAATLVCIEPSIELENIDFDLMACTAGFTD